MGLFGNEPENGWILEMRIQKLTDTRIIETLIRHSDVLKKFGVKNWTIWLLCQEKQREDSDIDFLVEFEKPDYDNFMNLIFPLEEFIKNELLKRGCARSLEIIGEAVKNLSPELKDAYREVDWEKIAGMRDKINHYYFGVNYDILWQTVREKLPALKEKIELILKGVEKNESFPERDKTGGSYA